MNRDMLARRLQKRGFDMLLAEDGVAGVDLAQKQKPDLILMDMSLPKLDGWGASRQLKADPQTAAIPIIALTAHAMAEDREKALAAGCDEFETKPVDLASLLAKMETLLGKPSA
jgi:CheY-like chemotaxis protein